MTVAVQLDLLAPSGAKLYPASVPAEVCDLFEQLALEVVGRGFKRYSSDAILHRVRWHHHVERGNREFKANNNWTPVLARWFISRHPDKPEFFELRESPRRGAAR